MKRKLLWLGRGVTLLTTTMDYTVTSESFDTLSAIQDDRSQSLVWSSVFVLPAWLKAWWQEFQPEADLYLRAVREENKIIGIAPLMIIQKAARFVSSADVCDYLDFVIAPGKEQVFFEKILDDLRRHGIKRLDLGAVRPDSSVMMHLVPLARSQGWEVVSLPEDVSLELDLPATWEAYLELLDTKQRHEVRRKLRRLSEAGNIEFQTSASDTEINSLMDTFLRFFTTSREDKARFMTNRMETFFRALSQAMAGIGVLRFGTLKLDSKPVAMIMTFDFNNVVYLYNSGYDPQFESLSAGLLSKVLCIQESIQEKKRKFDFLKGSEPYKSRLGGKEVPLYRCQITLG